jgi:hypothetical protein
MDELAKALTNPAWWILTVAVGLLLNLVAPFISKGMEGLWARYSESRRTEIAKLDATFAREEQRLGSSQNGLIEVKLEVIYRGLRVLVGLTVTILAVQVTYAVPSVYGPMIAVVMAMLGYLGVYSYWKAWKRAHDLHNAVVERHSSNPL